MNKRIKTLTILFFAQLTLIFGLNISEWNGNAKREPGLLLEAITLEVDEFTLQGSNNEKIYLVKKDNNWLIKEPLEFPADSDRVQRFLGLLAGLEVGTPIADSSDARKRFSVSADDFERRIALSSKGEKLVELFLGTSPGMRRIHARLADSDDIYAIPMSAYDAPIIAQSWEDKSILSVSEDSIFSFEIDGFTFLKSEVDGTDGEPKASWISDGFADDKDINEEAVQEFISLIAKLTFDEVVFDGKKHALEESAFKVTVLIEGGQKTEYQFFGPENEGYSVSVSTRPERFKLTSYQAAPIFDAYKQKNFVSTVTEPTK